MMDQDRADMGTWQEHNVFSSTVIVHEPRSEQLFFVNLPLLQDLYGNSSTPSERISEALLSWTAFIEVRGSSSQVNKTICQTLRPR